MELTCSFLDLLQHFAPVFTAPTYQTFVVIVSGWVLSQRHRFITEVIFSGGKVGVGHWSRFHRFFSHAAWDIDTFSLALARMVVTILAPGSQRSTRRRPHRRWQLLGGGALLGGVGASRSPRFLMDRPADSLYNCRMNVSEQGGRRSVSDSGTSIAAIGLTLAALAAGPLGLAAAQPPAVQSGEVVPRDVRQIYDRGLRFLADSQSQDGTWDGGKPGPGMMDGLENAARADGSWASEGKQGAGVTALALLAFLASGEDANFGIYSGHIRKALRSLIDTQDAKTGYFGPSMYHHGFAMLALAEAYGAVDEQVLWPDEKARRSIGQALELAVRTAITAQKKNSNGAWRYSPGARDTDASVTGAVIIGLLAARNAGIEVPDESIDQAIVYLRSMTDRSGDVFYLNQGNRLAASTARVSIATLTYAVARRKDLAEYKATLSYLKQRIGEPSGPYGEYTLYYEAQALFQGDLDSWKKWNDLLVRQLREAQQPDGSIRGRFNPPISTSLALLSLAVNYRFLPIYER
jgi:Family of unknown function (DUF6288)